jgi:hypothetical protein
LSIQSGMIPSLVSASFVSNYSTSSMAFCEEYGILAAWQSPASRGTFLLVL